MGGDESSRKCSTVDAYGNQNSGGRAESAVLVQERIRFTDANVRPTSRDLRTAENLHWMPRHLAVCEGCVASRKTRQRVS